MVMKLLYLTLFLTTMSISLMDVISCADSMIKWRAKWSFHGIRLWYKGAGSFEWPCVDFTMLPQIFLPGFGANLFAINKFSSRTSQCQVRVLAWVRVWMDYAIVVCNLRWWSLGQSRTLGGGLLHVKYYMWVWQSIILAIVLIFLFISCIPGLFWPEVVDPPMCDHVNANNPSLFML